MTQPFDQNAQSNPYGQPGSSEAYSASQGSVAQGATQSAPVQGQPYAYGYGTPVGQAQVQPTGEPSAWAHAGQVPYGQQAYGQYIHPAYARYAAQYPGYPAAAYAQQPVQQQKRKRGKGFWAGMIIALLAVVAAVVLVLAMVFGNQQSNRGGSLGQLDGKSDAEIQAELDRIVSEGMFNISIASVVQLQNGSATGDLRIENVPGNPYLMQVTITRDDTGEQIYESGVLEQNYHIQSDTLDVVLPKGSYPCTATFHALDPDTEQEVGTAGAQILVEVLS